MVWLPPPPASAVPVNGSSSSFCQMEVTTNAIKPQTLSENLPVGGNGHGCKKHGPQMSFCVLEAMIKASIMVEQHPNRSGYTGDLSTQTPPWQSHMKGGGTFTKV